MNSGPPAPELAPGIPLHMIPNENFFALPMAQALPKDDHAASLPDAAEIPEHEIDFLSPSTLKLLMADDIPDEVLKNHDASKAIPPLYGALVKNEQDVHLLERLAFMHRRESRR